MSRKSGGLLEALLGFFAIMAIILKNVLVALGFVAAIGGGLALICFIIEALIETFYYNGKKFKKLQEELNENTEKCNQLNYHLSELKSLGMDYHSNDYGISNYYDNSEYNYKRPQLEGLHNNTPNEYFCSLSVCKNAQAQPFKYLCKYFDIAKDEQTLNKFENMLNCFSAAEEGKQILLKEREELIENHKKSIPFTIRKFRLQSFFEKLGYSPIDLSDAHIPKYSFKYISGGGKSSMQCDIVLDIENLERFVSYLYNEVQTSKSIKYQRALMSARLREIIKRRDNYTCQRCGISIEQEPHLLLEIDHIIPLSKNGKTTEANLQTLCWMCNRQKSDKISIEFNNAS